MLKYLPSEKAKDARNFVQALQYWLGGNRNNLENLLKATAQVCRIVSVSSGGSQPSRQSALCLPPLGLDNLTGCRLLVISTPDYVSRSTPYESLVSMWACTADR